MHPFLRLEVLNPTSTYVAKSVFDSYPYSIGFDSSEPPKREVISIASQTPHNHWPEMIAVAKPRRLFDRKLFIRKNLWIGHALRPGSAIHCFIAGRKRSACICRRRSDRCLVTTSCRSRVIVIKYNRMRAENADEVDETD